MKNRLLFLLLVFLFTSFTASAQNWIWGTERTGGSNITEGIAVATDANGNSFLTGWFNGIDTIGAYILNSGPAIHSAFIVKYDVNGNVLWAHQSIVPSGASGADLTSYWVTTDKEGNAYITGYFYVDTVSFGSYKLACGRQAMFLVKYAPNGNVLWAKQSTNKGSSFYTATSGIGVTTDRSNNVYVTGTFNEEVTFDTIMLNGEYGSFVAKYDSSGNLLWANAPAKANVGDISISADKHDNIYVAGNFSDTLVAGKVTLIPKYLNVTYAYIIKYDSNGNAIWAQRSSTPSGNSYDHAEVNDITTDTYGGVYLIGSLNDTISFGKFTLVSPASTGASNMYLAKFDSSGKVLWAKSSLGDPNSSQWQGFSVAADTLGNIFITAGDRRIGYDSIYFDGVTYQVTNTNDGNSLLLQMDTSGKALCGEILPGVGDDRNCVATSPGGNYVNFGGDLETNVIIGPDTLSYDVYVEMPFMARWNPCFSSAIKLANQVNYNCTAGTATAVITTSGALVSSTTWNTVPVQKGDTATELTTGTYIATLILANAPDTIFDTIMVKSAGFRDSITVSPSSPIICNKVTLTASGGTYYTWSPATGLSATTGSSVIANPTVTTVYTVIGDNGNCTAMATDTVTVIPAPPLIILPQPPPLICFSFESDTLGVATQGSDFTWSPSEGLSATTGATVIANPSVSVTYTVTGIDSLGCPATGTEPVTILQIANQPSFSQHNDTLISSDKYDNQWYRNDTLLINDTSQYLIISVLGNYYVEINNEANGCSTSSDTVTITSLTGINQLTVENGQLTVYPNPTSDQLTVISNQLPIDEIDIVNELGQILLKVPLGGFRGDIDLSDLSSGMYFITVINKTGRAVVPVVKQ